MGTEARVVGRTEFVHGGIEGALGYCSQRATPLWWEQVPLLLALKLYVPSRHCAVAPVDERPRNDEANIGFSAAVSRRALACCASILPARSPNVPTRCGRDCTCG
jgi:hypothetical protein